MPPPAASVATCIQSFVGNTGSVESDRAERWGGVSGRAATGAPLRQAAEMGSPPARWRRTRAQVPAHAEIGKRKASMRTGQWSNEVPTAHIPARPPAVARGRITSVRRCRPPRLRLAPLLAACAARLRRISTGATGYGYRRRIPPHPSASLVAQPRPSTAPVSERLRASACAAALRPPARRNGGRTSSRSSKPQRPSPPQPPRTAPIPPPPPRGHRRTAGPRLRHRRQGCGRHSRRKRGRRRSPAAAARAWAGQGRRVGGGR